VARVKIGDIVDQLNSEMRRALSDAVSRVLPGAEYDQHELFREFRRAIGHRCNAWENVPDSYVEKQC